MKHLILIIAFALSFSACASNPAAPANIRLRQDVIEAIDGLTALAKGIEATADAKVITNADAHDALDIIAAANGVLRKANTGAYGVLNEVLTQVGNLSWASKIRKYLDLAKILLAALKPGQVATMVNPARFAWVCSKYANGGCGWAPALCCEA